MQTRRSSPLGTVRRRVLDVVDEAFGRIVRSSTASASLVAVVVFTVEVLERKEHPRGKDV